MPYSTGVGLAGAETIYANDIALAWQGDEQFAGVYEYENLTLKSGVQVTSYGISQLVLIIRGTLRIEKGAAIRVRNGYYPEAPASSISAMSADSLRFMGISKGAYTLYPGLYGAGGAGGAGGDSYYGGGGGGGGGYGGGAGGTGGSPKGRRGSGGSSILVSGSPGGTGGGNNPGSGGFNYMFNCRAPSYGGEQTLPETGSGSYHGDARISCAGGGKYTYGGSGDDAYAAGGGGGGGAGNGGYGGNGKSSAGGGGGGGYGGGVLTIIADRIVVEDDSQPCFIVSGQAGGLPGNWGQAGKDGEGGMLSILAGDYSFKTAHWSVPYATLPTRSLDRINYYGGHSPYVTGKPQKVFVNEVQITTGNESVPSYKRVTGISLNRSSASLRAGETVALNATVSPADASNKAVNWSSSDASVASVSGGVVSAKAPGSATITATSAMNPGVAAICTITVEEPPVAVSGVALDAKELNLKVGDKQTLRVMISPANAEDQSVTWSSNDAGVATVSGGVVTAKGAGSAVIEAVSVSNPSQRAICVVNVKAAGTEGLEVPVSGLTLSKKSITLKKGAKSTLKATITPSDATDKDLVWSSGKTSVATVKNGVVTAKAVGSATITVTSRSNPKIKASCKVTVKGAAVKSIIAPQKKVYLKLGTSAKLAVAPVTTDGTRATLTWKSSNAKIVSVSKNGKVKAIKKGKATITGRADNGKTVKITVYSGSGKPTKSVSIKNPPKKNTLRRGSALKLNIGFKPANAQGALAFKSSDAKVISVDVVGQLRALKKGTATITVTLGGKKKTLKLKVN